jgi:ankyrin repeat protein
MQALISAGATADVIIGRQRTALISAWDLEPPSADIVTMLLRAGADALVDHVDYLGVSAPLLAVQSEAVDALQAMIDVGADVNKPFDHGVTLLMEACRIQPSSDAVVAALLAAGAAVDALDDDGMTALFYAVEGGNVTAVRLLLEAGADAMVQDSEGRTVLMLSCDVGVGEEIEEDGFYDEDSENENEDGDEDEDEAMRAVILTISPTAATMTTTSTQKGLWMTRAR